MQYFLIQAEKCVLGEGFAGHVGIDFSSVSEYLTSVCSLFSPFNKTAPTHVCFSFAEGYFKVSKLNSTLYLHLPKYIV